MTEDEKFRDVGPVEIPYLIVFKLALRYDTLRRLERIGAPRIILEKEHELIDSGLRDLHDYAVEHGYYEPHR